MCNCCCGCHTPGPTITDEQWENVKTGKATLKLGLDLQNFAAKWAVYTAPSGDKLHVVVPYSMCIERGENNE